MKRSPTGEVIHRDDCKRAGKNAVHWRWADGMSDEELFVRLLDFPFLNLARCCFEGTKEDLAARAVES